MNMNELLKSQAAGLPEDILKRKWAGDFAGAIAAIDARLQRDIPELLKNRLLVERELIARLPAQYPYTKKEAVAAIQKQVPDFTEAEFDKMSLDGGVDFIYVQGEPRYFESVVSGALFWDKGLNARAGKHDSYDRPILDQAIADLKKEGSLGYRLTFKVEYHIDDKAFVPGETYRVHLPVPKPSAQQSNIDIAPQLGGIIAPESAHARTVFYERTLDKNEPFIVEYAYDSRVHYIDVHGRPDIVTPLYHGVPEPTADDLKEQWPHIAFTPYLVELAKELRGAVKDDILVARAIYDYVTKNVTYSFLRDYALIGDMAEYMALGLRGDCGAQAVLFITLCRLNGIPARWQSGTVAREDATGPHDWAQFYVEPYGWLFADPSFGGSAWRGGHTARWNFYFGNLDPFRMVANDMYMAPLLHEPDALRMDPYDNQSGECEVGGRTLQTEERTVKRTLKVEKL